MVTYRGDLCVCRHPCISPSLTNKSCLGLTVELVNVVVTACTYLFCSRKALDFPSVTIFIIGLIAVIHIGILEVVEHHLVHHIVFVLDIVHPVPDIAVSNWRKVLI